MHFNAWLKGEAFGEDDLEFQYGEDGRNSSPTTSVVAWFVAGVVCAEMGSGVIGLRVW